MLMPDKYPRFDELSVHPLVLVRGVRTGGRGGSLCIRGARDEYSPRNERRLDARSTTRKSRLPGLLVAVQVALTCVLLVTSGLFVRTLRSLEDVSSDSIRAA